MSILLLLLLSMREMCWGESVCNVRWLERDMVWAL